MNPSPRKVVLITGCSSGFGFLTALLFAKKGWIVYGTLRNPLHISANTLHEAGVRILKMDITNEQEVVTAVQAIYAESKRIDVLVNNAGAGFLGAIEDFTTEELQAQFDVNLFGVHRLLKKVLPIMRSQKSGRIINIGSMAGRSTTALYGAYSATKFALEALSETLNLEVSKWGITVSVVEPGSFATDFGTNIRKPEASTSDSPYATLLNANKNMRKTLDGKKPIINHFRNPQRVAALVYRIANTPNPRLRYPIGIDARGILLAQTLIPYKIRLLLLKTFYKW